MRLSLPDTTTMTLAELRASLARAFSEDTAAPGTIPGVPSTGHCAAAAAIVQAELGGQFVSTIVGGQSHWFNRLAFGGSSFDVDLTGDQFGFAEIRIALAGELFPAARLRAPEQLNDETLRRALLLAERADLSTAQRKLSALLTTRTQLATVA